MDINFKVKILSNIFNRIYQKREEEFINKHLKRNKYYYDYLFMIFDTNILINMEGHIPDILKNENGQSMKFTEVMGM